MTYHANLKDLLPYLYNIETNLAGIFDDCGFQFAPVLIAGQVGDPGIYNLPATTPVTTESVTYQAAGVPVSDTYTGTTLWDLLNDAGGVTTTTAKNDILSKYVIATGSDGYQAVFSAGEIDPSFGNQPDLVAYSDTAGQLGPNGSDGLARMVVPGDIAGGRYVSDLVSLKVESLPEPGPAGPGGISPAGDAFGRGGRPDDRNAGNPDRAEPVHDGNGNLSGGWNAGHRHLYRRIAMDADPGRRPADGPVDQE